MLPTALIMAPFEARTCATAAPPHTGGEGKTGRATGTRRPRKKPHHRDKENTEVCIFFFFFFFLFFFSFFFFFSPFVFYWFSVVDKRSGR